MTDETPKGDAREAQNKEEADAQSESVKTAKADIVEGANENVDAVAAKSTAEITAVEVVAVAPPKLIEPVAEAEEPPLVRAAYEHPLPIRITHWVNAISLFVMVTSGLRIFRAFPSFGPKIPEKVLLNVPPLLTLGGWLGGALQWHLTFMWFFAASGIFYFAYQIFSGHYRTMLFMPRDIPGVWPMTRHYFFFGPKPPVIGQYNPLQKLAYTSTIGFGVLSLLTGIVLYKPAQFSWLALLFGGFHLTRIWHFAAMCGFLAFIPGHLIMVLLHGWANFYSMLSGWRREPEYQE
jgi:Ni/Fe-hydrogenase b-type cytochrome subunit